MINYYKYLPVSAEDQRWGLYVLNAGCNSIGPSEAYPRPGHPSRHHFQWEQGRVLQEFQVIYISRGAGVFESTHCPPVRITEGTVMLLFPGEWHRFRPDEATGWDEWWAGFKGDIPASLREDGFFSPAQPLLHTGLQETILQLLTDIIAHTRSEKPGYQPLVSGVILHLLGYLHAWNRQAELQQEDVQENIVHKAMQIIRANVDRQLSIESLAEELCVSYSWLRKAFRQYTGIAPGQYLLQLKIERAKMLLADPSKSLKVIAAETGFESAFYFSKIFKVKTGVSPDLYRKTHNV
ncbi:helix-turn-helix transcriptional regulator [Chitinophaga cymbidii]|uniref:helix-turn-helix transcriptional regulator n=1 Tax=Chitinophaga cymbidii TaxID=1096750 RepID=UPI0011BF383B|nr:helix-turn-helix domain-containing protein [Chitinophaga cymbidii]